MGGLQAGLDIWEIAIIPALLNNCQTWINMSESSLKMLDSLQNDMYRTLLSVPRTCPLPSLCWDMGGLQMKYRVIIKKLEFLWHLVHLEKDTLASEILTVQREQNLPGLVAECEEWMETHNLPNLFEVKITQPQWKMKVKKALREANSKDLRTKMLKYEKLKNSELVSEDFGTKSYVKTLSVRDARVIFKKRVSMTQHVKMNYMSDLRYAKSMWLCDSCETSIDSMNHVLWCVSYREIRAGKNLQNDRDLANYLHEVFKIRSNMEVKR